MTKSQINRIYTSKRTVTFILITYHKICQYVDLESYTTFKQVILRVIEFVMNSNYILKSTIDSIYGPLMC